MKENKFEVKDEVLIRDIDTEQWSYAIFSHYNNVKNTNYPYVTSSKREFAQCIPYKGNEHLVGTTDKPKEDLPINTPVMVCDDDDDSGDINEDIWYYRKYAGNNKVFRAGYTENKDNYPKDSWKYIIPCNSFNFNNPKNSLDKNIVK